MKVTESVKHRVKNFIGQYMVKCGPVYEPSKQGWKYGFDARYGIMFFGIVYWMCYSNNLNNWFPVIKLHWQSNSNLYW